MSGINWEGLHGTNVKTVQYIDDSMHSSTQHLFLSG